MKNQTKLARQETAMLGEIYWQNLQKNAAECLTKQLCALSKQAVAEFMAQLTHQETKELKKLKLNLAAINSSIDEFFNNLNLDLYLASNELKLRLERPSGAPATVWPPEARLDGDSCLTWALNSLLEPNSNDETETQKITTWLMERLEGLLKPIVKTKTDQKVADTLMKSVQQYLLVSDIVTNRSHAIILTRRLRNGLASALKQCEIRQKEYLTNQLINQFALDSKQAKEVLNKLLPAQSPLTYANVFEIDKTKPVDAPVVKRMSSFKVNPTKPLNRLQAALTNYYQAFIFLNYLKEFAAHPKLDLSLATQRAYLLEWCYTQGIANTYSSRFTQILYAYTSQLARMRRYLLTKMPDRLKSSRGLLLSTFWTHAFPNADCITQLIKDNPYSRSQIPMILKCTEALSELRLTLSYRMHYDFDPVLTLLTDDQVDSDLVLNKAQTYQNIITSVCYQAVNSDDKQHQLKQLTKQFFPELNTSPSPKPDSVIVID